MFGKIEWFEPSKDKIVKPANWRGWAYFAVWAAVYFIPLKLIFERGHVPETLIWALVAGGMFLFDFGRINKRVREKAEYDKLFFISDDETPSETSTSNYHMKIE